MTRLIVAPPKLAFALLLVLISVPVIAQESSPSRPFGLDPYKPSDAKLLRELGPSLVTRMSTADIAKLDPYNPTDASLLRQMGGAIPFCCLEWVVPTGPQGSAGYVSSLFHLPGPLNAPSPVAKVVWVCKGSSCVEEDVSTPAP